MLEVCSFQICIIIVIIPAIVNITAHRSLPSIRLYSPWPGSRSSKATRASSQTIPILILFLPLNAFLDLSRPPRYRDLHLLSGPRCCPRQFTPCFIYPSTYPSLYPSSVPLHTPVFVLIRHPTRTPLVSGVSEACHQLVVMTLLMAVFCTRHGDTPCRVVLMAVQEDLNR